MKRLLLSILAGISVNAFASVGDSGQIGIIYITNSSGEDVKLMSGNRFNGSGYTKFNCLYQVPKKNQDVPSPAFKTMYLPGTKQTTQYAVIPSGSSAEFAFNSSCDDGEHLDGFEIRSSDNYNKLYVMGTLYQDINEGLFNYSNRINISSIGADVLTNGHISPFQITVLPINQ